LQDGHPLAFVSKPLGPRTRGLSTYDKEYLAILVAIQQWRSYLQHCEFIIFTDQKSLVHVTDQRLHTPWQLKMYTKLAGLQYKVVYKPGVSNQAADALSRHRQAPAQLEAISSVTPSWLVEVIEGYQKDPEAVKLLQHITLKGDSHPPFSLHEGVLQHKGRIWIGSNKSLQLRIMAALHNSAVGGHSGIPVTTSRVKKLFVWKGLKSDICDYVNRCLVCLQAKPDWVSYPRLLSPLPVPSQSWQIVSMDFIDGLPTSGSANCLMVVVDKFSKYAQFIPLHHPYTGTKVAQVFLDNVYKLHGMPTHIISDRDPVFTSTFWRELFRLANVQLCLSLAYHPQSDGQTERVNQCLEAFLRCFVHSCPRRWLRWVSLAEYWYNTSLHSALGKSPFEVLYGHSPKHFGISDAVVSPVQDVATLMNERETMLRSVHQHLLRAQQRMKHQADKHRSERNFAISDQVFLRLQPCVQSSLAPRSHHKLCFKYFGPFKIIDKIGSVAYKLALPPSSTIHPVFHVSLLKPAPPQSTPVSSELPDTDDALQILEEVLQTRIHQHGTSTVPQFLIKWSNMIEDMATWEDAEFIKQRFPASPAWGQAGAQGVGGVSIPHAGSPSAATRPRRGKRDRRTNPRIAGPEWSCKACYLKMSG